MSLQIKYSKELIKEYGQVGVYLPGTPINIGDIITFDFGKNIFGKARPLGSFQKKNSLKNLGVKYMESDFDNDADTYYFKSSGTKIFDTGVNASGDLGNEELPKAKGNLGIKLSSEGSLFILAIDCNFKRIENIADLENKINSNGKKMIWDDTFLVSAITVASKALILQSKTSSSEFSISGDVQGIKTNSANVNADAKLAIKTTNGNAFVKPWSDNVTLFMEVMKFEKDVFEDDVNTRDIKPSTNFGASELIKLRSVNISELLNDK
ncbi:hypothetical protein [Psychroserpens sp.]